MKNDPVTADKVHYLDVRDQLIEQAKKQHPSSTEGLVRIT